MYAKHDFIFFYLKFYRLYLLNNTLQIFFVHICINCLMCISCYYIVINIFIIFSSIFYLNETND